MSNITPSKVKNSLDKSPMYFDSENDKDLSKDFRNYKCEKDDNLENASLYDNSSFETPDEFLMAKIVQQVEFLLSDANILKDKFLLKHIRRNKEGYVSLKLISSLRKVKALTKDWRVVAYSLQKSQKLQMNDEKTKIKRKDPLFQLKTLDTSRTVLVFHYLPSCWSPDSLKRQLKNLGTVAFLEIVNSKSDVWYDSVQKTLSFYGKISTLPFAVVMFETQDEAANAVLQTSHPSSVILKIVPMIEERISKKSSPSDKNEFAIEDAKLATEASFDIQFEQETCGENGFCSSILNFFPSVTTGSRILYHVEKNSHQPHEDVNPQVKQKSLLPCTYKGDGPVNNIGYQRKSCFRNHKESRVIILRQPKGPDGTKGFWKYGEQKPSPGYNICVLY